MSFFQLEESGTTRRSYIGPSPKICKFFVRCKRYFPPVEVNRSITGITPTVLTNIRSGVSAERV